MSFKVTPPPGTPASEWMALAEEERSLAEREAQALNRAAEVEAVAREVQNQLDSVRATLQKLSGTPVRADAENAFLRAMGIVVPPHTVSQATTAALALRKQALAARSQAVQVEEQSVRGRSDSLGGLSREIASLQSTAAELAKKGAELQAKADAEARAKAAEPIALTPKPPLPRAGSNPPPPPAAAMQPHAAHPPPPPPAASGAERRVAQRVALKAEITMGSDSNFFTGFSEDISETGVFVATYDRLLNPGTHVDLNLALPGHPPIQVGGVVKWVREPNDHRDGVFPGMGVAFQEIAPQDADAVRRFIKSREPLFWTE